MNTVLRKIAAFLIIILMAFENVNVINVKAAEDNKNFDRHINEFMDKYFSYNMKQYNVPGCAAIVVKDKKVIYKKSFGVADIDKKININTDKTTFPACSVSKLFTATAIMQLRDEGKLNLDDDINKYIFPYKIENKYNKKVTIRSLLTHSSGLDEDSDLVTKTVNKDNIKSQNYYMEKNPSRFVREPQIIIKYNNHGFNILGYIVEKVSKMSYEDYVEENILKPLNMDGSSVRLYDNNIASGYSEDKKLPLSYQYTSGSSGIIAPVSDMAKFMMAVLDGCQGKDTEILKSSTIKEMEKKQFANSKCMAGMGLGFIRSDRNDVTVIKHEGGLPGYTTTMFLIPKENLGIYIATNTLGPLPFKFEYDFLNEFYPKKNNEFKELIKNKKKKDYSEYEGTYRGYDGICTSLFTKVGALGDNDTKVKDNKDGTLILTETPQDHVEITTRLVEKEHGIFVREDNKGYFAFKYSKDGKLYAFNDVSISSFEKIKFYETREFIITVFILVIISIVINLILRIRNRNIRNVKQNLNIISEIFGIIGYIGCSIVFVILVNNNDACSKVYLYVFLSLILISIVFYICSIMLFVKEVIQKKLKLPETIYMIIIYGINFIYLLLLQYYNLIGFKIS